MKVIDVVDLTKIYIEKVKTSRNVNKMKGWENALAFHLNIWFNINEDVDKMRVLEFYIEYNYQEIDWIRYHIGEKGIASFFRKNPDKHDYKDSTAAFEVVERFCLKYENEIKAGIPIKDILKMDTENILSYTGDNPTLKRTIDE